MLLEDLLEVLGDHRRRRRVLLVLVLRLAPTGIEAVEEDLLPVDLVFVVRLRRLLLEFDLLLDVRLGELEERILRHLGLEVLLEIQEGHVQQLHGLVETRIDPHLLLHLLPLEEAGADAAAHEPSPVGGGATGGGAGGPGNGETAPTPASSGSGKRARIRAVRVGPR